VCFLLLAGAAGRAQVPPASSSQFAPLPAPGFMPPYEIARTVRRAGFEPLAPPLREGSTYVLRATDFRGILMRVVVDARSGAIRDVNRIVPGPGSYGQQVGMMPYGSQLDDLPPPYGQPADFDVPPAAPADDGEILARPPVARSLTRASVTILPPMPRPRPAELASRKPIDAAKPEARSSDAKSETKPNVAPASASGNNAAAKPAAATDSKPDAKPAADAKPQASPQVRHDTKLDAAAPAVPPASPAPTAAAKPSKSLEAPAIND
jgi:hypothetical protein